MPKQKQRRVKKNNQRSTKATPQNCTKEDGSGPSGISLDRVTRKKQAKTKIIRLIIDHLLTPSPLQKFFNQTIMPEVLNSAYTSESFLKVLMHVSKDTVDNESRQPIIQYKLPSCFIEFLLCEDLQFEDMLHLTRKTVQVCNFFHFP